MNYEVSQVTIREMLQFHFVCVIALFPLGSQEYNILNGSRGERGQDTNEMEVLNRYNEMHTKDYGEFQVPLYFITFHQALSGPRCEVFRCKAIEKMSFHSCEFYFSKFFFRYTLENDCSFFLFFIEFPFPVI